MKLEERSAATKYQRVEQEEESQSDEDVESEWTTRRKLLLLGLCLVNVVSFGTMSLIMPYFPTVGVEMGLSKTVIGFIFSVCPLVGVFVSALTGMMFAGSNPKCIISGGLLLGAAAQVMFGFGKLLPPGTPFVVWCFVFRILTAVGTISSYTATLAILPQEFTTNYATVLGISEIFTGLGLAGVPVIAGLIYQAGGYMWPPITFGLLMLVVALFLMALFWNTHFKGPEKDTRLLQRACELLKSTKILIAVDCVFIASISFTVLEPIYALFGKKILHLNAAQIGLIYTPMWIANLIASGCVGILVDEVGKHLLLMITGFATSALGYILIGPAPALQKFLPVGTIWLTVVAEICIGVGLGFAYIPPLPYMVQSVRDAGSEIDIATSGLLSALFTSATTLGVFVGPTLAGFIADFVSVRMDFEVTFKLKDTVSLQIKLDTEEYRKVLNVCKVKKPECN